MRKINIAICDDEADVLHDEFEIIDDIFGKKDVKYHIDLYSDSKQLVESGAVYDILFLDIEMTSLSGVDIAKAMKKKNKKSLIFFITNYYTYINDALDIKALRYFVKPLNRAEAEAGIDRALRELANESKIIQFSNLANKAEIEVNIESIIYLESEGRHSHIVTSCGDFKSEESFKIIKFKIDQYDNHFALCYRDIYVNLKYVCEYNSENVYLINHGNTIRLYMSRRKFREFDEKMFIMAREMK